MKKNNGKVSMKKGVKNLVASIIIMMIGIMEIPYRIFIQKVSWPSDEIDVLFLLLGLVGVALAVLSAFSIRNTALVNESLQYPEYGLDYQAEFKSYRLVGVNKRRKKKGIKFYRNYSEWKEDLEKKHTCIKNDENAYHFLLRKLRSKRQEQQAMTGMVIPIEVLFVGIICNDVAKDSLAVKLVSLVCIIVFMIFYLSINYFRCGDEIDFIEDFIDIIFPDLKNKK